MITCISAHMPQTDQHSKSWRNLQGEKHDSGSIYILISSSHVVYVVRSIYATHSQPGVEHAESAASGDPEQHEQAPS